MDRLEYLDKVLDVEVLDDETVTLAIEGISQVDLFKKKKNSFYHEPDRNGIWTAAGIVPTSTHGRDYRTVLISRFAVS